MHKPKADGDPSKSPRKQIIVSKHLNKGGMLELIYAPRMDRTAFAHWDGSDVTVISTFEPNKSFTYQPVKASNNLIKHGVIKLPSFFEEFGDYDQLVDEVRGFINSYVDLEPEFETVAVYYVILTWVYDRFRELPYLRLIGDYGTGKTRFLQIVGSLCYKPVFASGASTISPIFHSLDTFGGTLILDEADFRFSDAKSEITKILNNGSLRGFPVLRCEGSSGGVYSPRAFSVFGPKILATRHHFDDPALESRLITSVTKAGSVRKDIPLNLPDEFEQEAQSLRNKLLMFRFKYWDKIEMTSKDSASFAFPRLAQIYRPLLAVAHKPEARDAILLFAEKSGQFLRAFQSHSVEEQTLGIIRDLYLAGAKLSVGNIATRYRASFGQEHLTPITPRWIGSILRQTLHLETVKRQGVYVIPQSETPKLTALFGRYGVSLDETATSKPHTK